MQVRYKKLSAQAVTPRRATAGSAAYDLFCPADVYIPNGRTVVLLGFALEMPPGTAAEVRPRSGFSSKGMQGADGQRYDADVLHGLIDSDYRGEVGVIVRNADGPFFIAAGTRLAQMEFRRAEAPDIEETAELNPSLRGTGGFGSTGE